MTEELTSVQPASSAPSPETGGQAQAGGRAPQFGGRGGDRGARAETAAPQREAQPSALQSGETPQAQGGQPDAAEAKSRGFNLFEDENFRKVQSAWQRQLADLQRQNQDLAVRLRESELKGLDDFEKLQYEKRELEAAIRNMQQQRELEIMAYQRQQDIQQIAQATGVDASEIEQATDYANAWQRAALKLQQQVSDLRKQVERLEGKKKEANAPYLGGGVAAAAGGDMSSAFEAAKRSRDPAAWVRAVRESRR